MQKVGGTTATAVTLVLISIGAGGRAADAPAQCDAVVDRATQLNASQLFEGSALCVNEKRSFDATFLQIAGQIRAMTDMESLIPKKDEDKLKGASLYGQLFYVNGGAGDREVYRDPAITQKLLERIDAWMPGFPTDYDPGWQYKKRPSETAYSESVKYTKADRVAQLRWYATLVRNDEYYAAESEVAEIQKRNPRGIVAGSADYERMQQLSASMNKIVASVGKPDLPPQRPFKFEPDPDASFKQLFVGFNGPAIPGVTLIQNRPEAARSWLGSSLSEADFKAILAQINFDSQVLIAFAIGKRTGATGQVYVTDASYNTLLSAFSIQAAIGVDVEDCKFGTVESYPYAVVVAARPPVVPKYPGYGVSNFGDGCKPPRAGRPTPAVAPKP
jgi:hypothetical protein